MIAFLIIWAVLGWLTGAVLTLKADAMITNQPTNWRDWWLALLFWPGIAAIICCNKHTIYTEGPPKEREYRY